VTKDAIHVERSGDCWQVTQPGDGGVLSRHRRRLEAISDAMTLGNMHHTDVLIHELDGSLSGPFGSGNQPPEMHSQRNSF
jgi:hypothetical protein